MTSQGAIAIRVEMDIAKVESSLAKLRNDFGKFKKSAESVNSDFIRMDGIVKGVGTAMGALGLAGVTAMINMAKNAPATAGAMADIKLSMFELGLMMGEDLAPKFQMFAGLLSDFTVEMQSNPPFRKLMEDATFLVGAGALGGILSAMLKIKGFGPVAIAITYSLLRKDIKENLKGTLGEIGGGATSAGLDVAAGAMLGKGIAALLGVTGTAASTATGAGAFAGAAYWANEQMEENWGLNMLEVGTALWLPHDKKTNEKIITMLKNPQGAGIVGES